MAIKGKSTIELRSAKTGKLEQVVADENMVTNAVYNILNHHFDLNFDNYMLMDKLWWTLNPIWKQCFGGLLLFDGNLTEDVENIIAPATVRQVGHAGNPYTGNNPERGSLNSSESKSINDGKGYRFVWDFGTDKANGTIKSAALTSYAGGKVGQYGQYAYSENTGDRYCAISALGPIIQNPNSRYCLQTTYTELGGYTSFSQSSYSLGFGKWCPIGFFKDIKKLVTAGFGTAPHYLTNSITFKEVEFVKVPMSLFGSSPIKRVEKEKTVTATKKFCSPLELFSDEDFIYSVAATGGDTFDFIKIDGKTLEIVKEETYTIQDASFVQYPSVNDSSYKANIYPDGYFLDGYIYIKCRSQYSDATINGSLGRFYDRFYKINALDSSDFSIVRFDLKGIIADYALSELKGILMLTRQNTVPEEVTGVASFILLQNEESLLKFVFGWGCQVKNKFLKEPTILRRSFRSHIHYNSVSNVTISAGVYNAYLGTINNLSTPVVKNETQTMKVTYEITEV